MSFVTDHPTRFRARPRHCGVGVEPAGPEGVERVLEARRVPRGRRGAALTHPQTHPQTQPLPAVGVAGGFVGSMQTTILPSSGATRAAPAAPHAVERGRVRRMNVDSRA
jgi:hypothetical protein